MRRRALQLGMGLAVMAALGYLLLQGPARGPGPLRPAAGDAAADSGTLAAAQAPAASAGDTGDEPARQAVVDEQPAADSRNAGALAMPSFRGRILLPDGTPAAGAVVQAFGMIGFAAFVDASDARTRPLVDWSTQADRSGRFEFPEVGRDGLRFVLRARAGALPPAERSDLPAQPGRTRDLGDWRLVEGYSITGTVVDGDGNPVRGARVVPVAETNGSTYPAWYLERVPPLPGYVATSDAGGQFELHNLPAGRLRLQADASGHATGVSAPVSGIPGGVVDGITVLAPRSLHLEGVVLAPDRTPVAGARLQLQVDGEENLETRSDSRGRFQLDPPEQAESLQMQAVAAGFWPRRQRISAEQRRLPIEVVLSRLPPLRGYVLDSGGQGVAGAQVALVEARRTREDLGDPALVAHLATAATDADGSFALPVDLTATIERRFQVAAWDDGYAPAYSEVLALEERNAEKPLPLLRLVLGEGLAAQGVVWDAAGAPAAGARVHLRRLYALRGASTRRVLAPETRRPGGIYRTATATDGGGFAFTGLPAGDYRLEAYLPAHSPAESPDFALVRGSYECELRLPAACRIEGEVVGELQGLGQLRVTATSPRTDPVDALVGPGGRFILPDLLPETYGLVLRELDAGLAESGAFSFGSGEGLARRDGVALAPGQIAHVALVLDLAERASLEGQVLINGVETAELRVFLVPRDVGRGNEDPRLLWRTLSERMRSTSTDFRGAYRFAALDPGDYWLVVERAGTWPQNVLAFDPGRPGGGPTGLVRADLRLAPGEAARRDFNLMLGSVQGAVVRMETGGARSQRGGTARLKPGAGLEGVAERRVNLGRDGSFSADWLAAGTWTLSAASGAFAGSVPVQVPAGDATRVELRLERSDNPAPRPLH